MFIIIYNRFAVPFTFATTISLAYISLSTFEGKPLLSDELVNQGYIIIINIINHTSNTFSMDINLNFNDKNSILLYNLF